MKRVLIGTLGALLACSVVAQQPAAGIHPRTKVTEYALHHQAKDFSLGVAQLSSVEVANAFMTELNGRYIVLEIGVYPASGSAITVNRSEFALKVVGKDTVLRPASPETIAAVLQKRPGTERDIALYPTGGVGFGSGGTATMIGMGVGIGKRPTNGTSDADRKTMQAELTDKGLPEGKIEKPVAGYLYFPVSTKEKALYELEYVTKDGSVLLKLPAADAKAAAKK